MVSSLKKIGFGGGCHWCTEAVFQNLIGVSEVEQGWIQSTEKNNSFSEAVIVHFDSDLMAISILVRIHLHTHSSTSTHSMRDKYRSAVYVYNDAQGKCVSTIIKSCQYEFEEKLITQVLPFLAFKKNEEQYLNYYKKNAGNQFCQRYIHPKLQLIQEKFARQVLGNTFELDSK